MGENKKCRGLFHEEIMHHIGIESAIVVYDSKRRVPPLSARWRVSHDSFLRVVKCRCDPTSNDSRAGRRHISFFYLQW